MAWLRHLNLPGRSLHNVAHHYDLTDALFASFLDPWRQYSCAYFHSQDDDLDQAQVTKLARLAAKLNLQNGNRVLDIGCGWGGLARALAVCRDDVTVTGITLSSSNRTRDTGGREAGLATGWPSRFVTTGTRPDIRQDRVSWHAGACRTAWPASLFNKVRTAWQPAWR